MLRSKETVEKNKMSLADSNLARFGRQYVSLAEAIAQEADFSRKPLGPLGLYVKMDESACRSFVSGSGGGDSGNTGIVDLFEAELGKKPFRWVALLPPRNFLLLIALLHFSHDFISMIVA